MDTKAKTLMPAVPKEKYGYGRLRRILREYSTAPLELKLGFGSLARGIWQIFPHQTHPFVWTGLPLWFWGAFVAILGALQFLGCLYRWEKARTWAASGLAGALVYISAKYLINAPTDVALILYGTLLVGEVWVALRGWPVFGGYTLNGEVPDDN